MHKTILACFILFICSQIISCKSIFLNTVGRILYKKSFLQGKPASKNFTYTMPYQLVNRQIIVAVSINNHSYNFLFDTGSKSLISEDVVKELGIIPKMEVAQIDFNNQRVDSNLCILNNISIGDFVINDFSVLSANLQVINTNNCLQIDGIIGNNVMHMATFNFDREKKLLTISDPRSKMKHNKEIKIKIKRSWDENIIIKNISIDNDSKNFIFDSGYNGFLLLNDVPNTNLLKQRKQYGLSLTILKEHLVSFYKIDKVSIGKADLGSAIAKVYSAKRKRQNLLGSQLFTNTNVVIDFRHKRLYLSHVQNNKVDTLIRNINIGWKAVKKEYYISALTVNSELEKLGIQMTDTILAVNNVPASFFANYCSFRAFTDSVDMTKADLRLTILRGKKEQVFVINKELMFD